MTLAANYLPPLSWFRQAAHGGGEITLEAHEHYPKQTLRNRCYIDAPNRAIALTVPIDHSTFSAEGKCLMKDVRLSDQYDWRRQHWQALATSYYNAPFFEFLQDDLRAVYQRPWTFLLDLNEALIACCCTLLELDLSLRRTTQYVGIEECTLPPPPPYYQVFAQKHGFLSDLSIVDLLFNMGAEAPLYL